MKGPCLKGEKLMSKLSWLVGSKDHRRGKVYPAKEHHFAHVETEDNNK